MARWVGLAAETPDHQRDDEGERDGDQHVIARSAAIGSIRIESHGSSVPGFVRAFVGSLRFLSYPLRTLIVAARRRGAVLSNQTVP